MTDPHLGAIDSVLKESDSYPPPSWHAQTPTPSHAEYLRKWRLSIENPEQFWREQAKLLIWDAPFTKVHEWNPPHAKWFVDGRLNASVQCLDRHLNTAIAAKAAIHWIGEPGDRRTITYEQLWRETARFATALRNLGVRRGDRVALYMPLIPELVVGCLACARIGAIHTVVFGGFSAESLRDRIDDSQAVCVITADGGWRRGAELPLKNIVDQAVVQTPTIRNVIVVKRDRVGQSFAHQMIKGRDIYYDDLMANVTELAEPESMDSEDPLFILYTSGTTGKPKGIFHTHAGYLLGTQLTTREVFDLRPEDVFWCTADIGWITGHSYVIYGPMQLGATQVIYEGAPNWPEPDRFWRIVAEARVTVFYTAPTAVRAFMKWGDQWPARHDLSSLRLLGSVGEPINPEAWRWYHRVIGGGRCPIVDTWWQTETGAICITPLPGATTTKPGSATFPFYGIDATILTEDGREVSQGGSPGVGGVPGVGGALGAGGGLLAIRKPWPSMLRGVWGDPERYRQTYWSKWGGKYYFTGDGAIRDKDGYLWIVGRVDDVVNVAGHRIGTAELESAFVAHLAVSEAAVIGVAHEIKGQGLVGFVSLRAGYQPSDALASELREWIAAKIGGFAKPEKTLFMADLPKTRSGKIMRRLLRDIAEGKALGDTTTLADPTVLNDLKSRYEEG